MSVKIVLSIVVVVVVIYGFGDRLTDQQIVVKATSSKVNDGTSIVPILFGSNELQIKAAKSRERRPMKCISTALCDRSY